MDVVKRFDVYLVDLDPTVGSEIRKPRPCAIISPNEMNRPLRTVIIAPLTTAQRAYPSRIDCTFQTKKRQIVLDQIRTVDKSRLVRRLGTLGDATQRKVSERLVEMFVFWWAWRRKGVEFPCPSFLPFVRVIILHRSIHSRCLNLNRCSLPVCVRGS